jgi:hypothetical protein
VQLDKAVSDVQLDLSRLVAKRRGKLNAAAVKEIALHPVAPCLPTNHLRSGVFPA